MGAIFFMVSVLFLFFISALVPALALAQYLSFVDVDLWLLLRSPILLRIVSFYFLGLLVIVYGLHYLLSKRKTWAYLIYFLLAAGFWGSVSVFLVLKNSSFSVAVSNLAVFGFIILMGNYWIQYFSKSFFDSGRRWFQGVPSPIPGVNCVTGGAEWRVSRLDREGAYVFLDQARAVDFNLGANGHKPYELRFKYRNQMIEVPAELVHHSQDFLGFGFRFKLNDADLRKDLGDFIEKMRGYGYES